MFEYNTITNVGVVEAATAAQEHQIAPTFLHSLSLPLPALSLSSFSPVASQWLRLFSRPVYLTAVVTCFSSPP